MSRNIERKLLDIELVIKALPIVLVQATFFVVPMIMCIVLTFQEMQSFQLVWSWNLETWIDVFSHPHYWVTLFHTVLMAAACVILSTLIAFPFAYALATRITSLQNHIKVLIIFAFLTDSVLKIFGWVLFLDETGVLNWILALFLPEQLRITFLFSKYATLLGMVYNLLPFMIFTIFLSVDAIDRDIIRAAYDAGATKIRAFFEVTLPLSAPGIWAGSFLVFVLGLGVFLESKVLGGGKDPSSAELIRHTFETRINWPLGAALTVVLMSITVIAILLVSRISTLRKTATIR